MTRDDLQYQDYLGDGVYVGWDGYHVVLWLLEPSAFGPFAIALEPPLLVALQRYVGEYLPARLQEAAAKEAP